MSADVYRERNLAVLLAVRLARDSGRRVWMGRHSAFDPRDAASKDPDGYREYMNFVAIDLPTGQVTWTLHDSEVALFEAVVGANQGEWDGHSTDEKHKRLKDFAADARGVTRDALIYQLGRRLEELYAARAGSMYEHDDGTKDNAIGWCVVCGRNTVSADAGLDTCPACLKAT
jgi:hypothetical protein